MHEQSTPSSTILPRDAELCPVEPAARIIGQKWTLQIVYFLLGAHSLRFCELQDCLGGVNPSTLSSRLKMLEEVGLVQRTQVSAIPLHVEYTLTPMGRQLEDLIRAVIVWSNTWLSDECSPAGTNKATQGQLRGQLRGQPRRVEHDDLLDRSH